MSLHRRLIVLRRAHTALSAGAISGVRADGTVLRYERALEGARFLIVLNTGGVAAEGSGDGMVVVGTHAGREGAALHGTWALRPDEGVVLQLA